MGKATHEINKLKGLMKKQQENLDIAGNKLVDLVTQNQMILQALHHHRLIRMDNSLKLSIIANKDKNIACNYFDTEKGMCHCKSSPHYHLYCSFSFWFADCIQFRGPNKEIPEIYGRYKKKPEDFETLGGKKKNAHIKK